MPLTFPVDTKHARVVVVLVGPIQRLQLRHVPLNYLIYSTGYGGDREAGVERLRGQSERRGYTVEPAYAVEDGNARIRKMM
jgi:hypothetical protein